MLNQRQKVAYEAARAANAKVDIVKRVDEEGADVVLYELYESPNSADLSLSGKEKLRQTLVAMSTLEEGEVTKVMEVSSVYVKGSDASRLLAEERAQNFQSEFGQLAPNAVFSTMEAHENLPKGNNTQLIVIR